MTRRKYKTTRCKQVALVFCSFILSMSGCGCSEAHEHYALEVDCDDSARKEQAYLNTVDSTLDGGRMRTLVEEI